MMRRALLAPVLLAGIFAFTAPAADTKADSAKAKKALMEVGEFIGGWNLTGETKTTGKLTSWKEVATWSWKFKGDDSWINIEIKDGRFFTKGELKYLTAKKLYELTATDKDGKSHVYTGDFKKGKLALERKDEKTSDIQRLSFVTLSEGVRMAMQYETQAGGKGLFASVYKSTGNKDGESFAGGATTKKPECIVTGGAATISVSYMGKTYYVCCSGCKDEFNDSPKKYVDAFEKKK